MLLRSRSDASVCLSPHSPRSKGRARCPLQSTDRTGCSRKQFTCQKVSHPTATALLLCHLPTPQTSQTLTPAGALAAEENKPKCQSRNARKEQLSCFVQAYGNVCVDVCVRRFCDVM
uniref:Uncharacterized protein n=1 Tax=Knipowitschia caucasica TaxID=637954 RepID=A0AAV2KTM4_KNICA